MVGAQISVEEASEESETPEQLTALQQQLNDLMSIYEEKEQTKSKKQLLTQVYANPSVPEEEL